MAAAGVPGYNREMKQTFNFRCLKPNKIKKVGSITYLLSLKLTNLTKPKLMKKNVLQR
jgi:hypothetical protein